MWSQAAERINKEGPVVRLNVAHRPTDPPAIKRLEQSGCKVTRRRNQTMERARILRLLDRVSLRTVGKSYDWLDHSKPDLVIISQGADADGLPWMEACLKRGLTYVTIVHLVRDSGWRNDSETARLRAAYLASQATLFVSQANLETTEAHLATPLPNAAVIRNPFGVDYDTRPAWPGGTQFRMACVGSLEPSHKGQDVLFQVLRQEKWRHRPIQVTLYGDGGGAETLARLKEMWSLEMVKFGGFLDPARIWEREQALVMPSRREGLPLAVVEAMLCGRPCIVTDVGGNAEVVEDNITGFLAAAPTTPLLDEAMERAWNRRNEWRALGEAGAKRIRELIPRDPVGDFIQLVYSLVDEAQAPLRVPTEVKVRIGKHVHAPPAVQRVPPMVSVCMTAYNQEQYIGQAIESVLIQRASFDYEVVIGEDCSNDRTAEIVREYAAANTGTIRVLPNSENLGYRRNWERTLAACRGNYVAFLEGDDYWTCPDKLQRQVEALEANSDCSLTFSPTQVVEDGGSDSSRLYPSWPVPERTSIHDLLQRNYIHTSSLLVRNPKLSRLPDWVHRAPTFDWGMFVLFADRGDLFCISDPMSVYRYTGKGLWSSLSSLEQWEMALRAGREVDEGLHYRYTEALRLREARLHYQLALDYNAAGMIAKAREHMRGYFGVSPALKTWKLKLALLLQLYSPATYGLVQNLRGRRG